MTVRLPVVLVSLPNLPYLLGTFDTGTFRNWWRSAPFPDSLAEIRKVLHIYGRSYLVIARRVDGKWAVYRNRNYGFDDWELVYLTTQTIYDIVLINFGWAVMNTSDGFYETVKAGTTWTKVANLPSASAVPAFYNIGGGDVLVCTDGRHIWRSTDIARHWTQVCDMQTISFPAMIYYSGTFHYTGPSNPAIAGACGRVLAACGPHLVISEDAALTWEPKLHWCQYNETYKNFYPPRSIVYDRLWPHSNTPKFLVDQILISSVDGPTGGDVVFVVKYKDLYPVSGETKLYSRVFKTFSATYANYGYQKNWFFKYLFQQYVSPTEGSQISAYDVPVTGQNYNDRLVFSAQTRIDPATGKLVPSLKYSVDGGATWIDINVANAQIGDADGNPVSGLSFMDDNFAKNVFVSPNCDNAGSWSFTELYRRQCLSYEADISLKGKAIKADQVDVICSKTSSASQEIDGICEKSVHHPYENDGVFEGRQAKSYLLDRHLQGKVSHDTPTDVILSIDVPCLYEIDVGRMWKRPSKYYHLDSLMRSIVGHGYSCDVVLVEYTLGKRLSKMERKIPQFLDLDVPDVPYAPMNSEEETV